MDKPEKMRVLDMLDAGKITADEATQLLDALSGPQFISKDTRDNLEERISKFASEVNAFAKDVGCKVHGMYKDVEPKIKKASQTALEKTAAVLDDLANNINESLEKGQDECCGSSCACDVDEDTPREN